MIIPTLQAAISPACSAADPGTTMTGIDGYSIPPPVHPIGLPEMTGAARAA
jgi:hypothetical protein